MIRKEAARDRSWVLVVFLVALAMGLGAMFVSRAGAGTPPGEDLQAAARLTAQGQAAVEREAYAEAEPRLREALARVERALGPDDVRLIGPLADLADLYTGERRYAEAASLYQRWIAIAGPATEPDDPALLVPVSALAQLYREQGQLRAAAAYYGRLVAIFTRIMGPEDIHVAFSLVNLADVYAADGPDPEAEPLYRRAIAIVEQLVGIVRPGARTNGAERAAGAAGASGLEAR
ncbi:MAG: tetratricopeptide repeat protein [Candidatus Rokubacteria bacterium]|nr:tetratricopeptide repeat protein [Candidatus Rokubacteria bacterium]